MPWLHLTITVPRSQAARLGDLLEASEALAVTIEPASEEALLQAALEELPLWDRNSVTALYPEVTDTDAIVAALREMDPDLFAADPRIELLPDADWAQAWKTHYRPVHVAGKLWIVPSWLEAPDPQAINLLLDPGMAFGTGEHPTTGQCLEWLVANPPRNLTVVDYGCGSGILSIAAARLGASVVHAVDIDPQALAVTRENAERNNVADRIRTALPDEFSAPPAALVIANILAKPLIELAPAISAMVAADGSLLLSGMLDEQADEVVRAYPAFTFTRRSRAGWSLLIGARPW
jgi:ribosomal protein L11 methyltransferase